MTTRRLLPLLLAIALLGPSTAAAVNDPPVLWTDNAGRVVHQHTLTYRILDQTSGAWTGMVDQAIAWWDQRTILNVGKVAGGQNVTVQSGDYGDTGWSGLAVSGHHTTHGNVYLNDRYFQGDPGARLATTCQEIGHQFGLGHGGNDCMSFTYHSPASQDPQAGNTNLTNSFFTNDITSPQLTLNVPQTADQGSTVTVSISATPDDRYGQITRSTITTPQGTREYPGIAPSTTYTFGLGDNQVTAQVWDDRGRTSTRTATVRVSNAPPTLSITGTSRIDSGDVREYPITANDSGGIASTSWTVVRLSDNQTVQRGTAFPAAVGPLDPGDYELRASATDPQGATGTATFAINVTQGAPTATLADPGTVRARQPTTLTLTDIRGAHTATTWEVSGPGGAYNRTERLDSLDLTFSNAGTWTVTARLSAPNGLQRTLTRDITVQATELTLNASAPARVQAPKAVPITVQATGHEYLTVNWRNTSTGRYGGQALTTGTNNLALPAGPYTLTVTASNPDRSTDTELTTTVDPAPTTPTSPTAPSTPAATAPTVTPPTTLGTLPATRQTVRLRLRTTTRTTSTGARRTTFTLTTSTPSLLRSYVMDSGCDTKQPRISRRPTFTITRAPGQPRTTVCFTARPQNPATHTATTVRATLPALRARARR